MRAKSPETSEHWKPFEYPWTRESGPLNFRPYSELDSERLRDGLRLELWSSVYGAFVSVYKWSAEEGWMWWTWTPQTVNVDGYGGDAATVPFRWATHWRELSYPEARIGPIDLRREGWRG